MNRYGRFQNPTPEAVVAHCLLQKSEESLPTDQASGKHLELKLALNAHQTRNLDGLQAQNGCKNAASTNLETLEASSP